jgi:hypothetical protein
MSDGGGGRGDGGRKIGRWFRFSTIFGRVESGNEAVKGSGGEERNTRTLQLVVG